MACKQLTMQEYMGLVAKDPNPESFKTGTGCNCCGAGEADCTARFCFMDVVISPWFEETYPTGKQTPGSCEEIGATETGQYTSGGYVWTGCRFLFNNLPLCYENYKGGDPSCVYGTDCWQNNCCHPETQYFYGNAKWRWELQQLGSLDGTCCGSTCCSPGESCCDGVCKTGACT